MANKWRLPNTPQQNRSKNVVYLQSGTTHSNENEWFITASNNGWLSRQLLSKIQRGGYTVFLSHEVQSQTKLRVRTERRTMIKLGSERECLEGAGGGAFWGPGHGLFPHLEIGYTGVQPVKIHQTVHLWSVPFSLSLFVTLQWSFLKDGKVAIKARVPPRNRSLHLWSLPPNSFNALLAPPQQNLCHLHHSFFQKPLTEFLLCPEAGMPGLWHGQLWDYRRDSCNRGRDVLREVCQKGNENTADREPNR